MTGPRHTLVDDKVRYVWKDEETEIFLELINEANINAILNGKQQRNDQPSVLFVLQRRSLMTSPNGALSSQ